MRKYILTLLVVLLAFLFYVPYFHNFRLLDRTFDVLSQVFADRKLVFEDLNLGFEDLNQGWLLSGIGYTKTYDQSEKHSGDTSMRIEHVDGDAGLAYAGRQLPIQAARGKRLRFIAYVKTSNVGKGGAGLWMDVYGADGNLAFDNMDGRRIVGSQDWTRMEIALDIPREAAGISIGCSLWGNGTVWFDSLELTLETIDESPPLIEIRGSVTDFGGQPKRARGWW